MFSLTVPSCVAKLPRLMQSGPSQIIDPVRLADTRDNISGVLNLDGMQRVQEYLSTNTGSIRYKLQFDKDGQNRILISGEYSSTVIMECQRCLQPVDIEITRAVNVAVVADENEAKSLPRNVEPLIVSGRKLSLPMFFEDELLLALPLAPNHDTKDCHVRTLQSGQIDNDRQNPFTVLKDLKLHNSND